MAPAPRSAYILQPMRTRSLLRWLAVPAALLLGAIPLLACSHGPQVQAATAPGFSASGHGVSIVGVMKDGRLHPEAWKWIGAALSRPFGSGLCEAGFSERLKRDDPALFAFADREAKLNGVTEELLARFGAHAKGDLLLVVELWGEPPQKPAGDPDAVVAPPMGNAGQPRFSGAGGTGRGMGPGAGMGGPRGGAPTRMKRPGEDGSYGLAVSVYSPSTKQWVAAAKLTDAGNASEEGVEKLAQELSRMMPGAACAGWSFGEAAGAGSGSAAASASASAAGSVPVAVPVAVPRAE